MQSSWVKVKDPKTNHYYYFDTATGKSQWRKPTPVHSQSGIRHEDNPNLWITSRDKRGVSFFFNPLSKQSQWSSPLEAPPAGTPPSTKSSSPVRTLNPWIKCFDPKTEKRYFFNKHTGVSVWRRPIVYQPTGSSRGKRRVGHRARQAKGKNVPVDNSTHASLATSQVNPVAAAAHQKNGSTKDGSAAHVPNNNQGTQSSSSLQAGPTHQPSPVANSSSVSAQDRQAIEDAALKAEQLKAKQEHAQYGGVKPLFGGWVSSYDEDRERVYYFHVPTRRSTWTHPSLIEAAVSAREGESEPLDNAEQPVAVTISNNPLQASLSSASKPSKRVIEHHVTLPAIEVEAPGLSMNATAPSDVRGSAESVEASVETTIIRSAETEAQGPSKEQIEQQQPPPPPPPPLPPRSAAAAPSSVKGSDSKVSKISSAAASSTPPIAPQQEGAIDLPSTAEAMSSMASASPTSISSKDSGLSPSQSLRHISQSKPSTRPTRSISVPTGPSNTRGRGLSFLPSSTDPLDRFSFPPDDFLPSPPR